MGILQEIKKTEHQTKELYLMTKEKSRELKFVMGDYECFADPQWREAAPGVVTDIQIIREGTYPNRKKWAVVRGTMVNTEELNYEEADWNKLADVLVIQDSIIYVDSQYHDYVNVVGSGLRPIHLTYQQMDLCDLEKQNLIYEKIVKLEAKRCAMADTKAMKEICIRHFAELKLDCASRVCVYEDALFFVEYPGEYRDFCHMFVVEKDGTLKTSYAPRFAEKCKLIRSMRVFTLEDLLVEMDRLGISAGEDSGDQVEGVTPQERALLTTHKLSNGTVLVMFKAEEFRYDSPMHLKLADKVCCGIGFWSHRLGEENDYRYWID